MTESSSSPGASTSDVFVSYASQDAAVAHSIVETLEGQGIRCWIAPRDVTPGAHYADEIISAISGATALILVLSDSARASKHVGKEVERASSKGRPIIALRTGKAPLTPALEYFLSESQWIDAPDGHVAPALPRLVNAVQRLSHSAAGPTPGGAEISRGRAPADAPAKTGARWSKLPGRKLAALAVIAAAAALAYYAAPKFWPSKRAIPATVSAAATTNVAISDKSIAVLPFADMSETHDQEYFADGMAEEILDLLAKIPGLTVIGRTSSFSFKGKNEDLRTIGKALNAAYVLEGSVRKSGDAVRVTAQLINTKTGAHEWSETYDRPIGDVLKLQDAIAAAVVREMQLTVAYRYVMSRSTVRNADVYEFLLRGRHAADRWDQAGLNEAATWFQQALDRDPTSADAASELAWTYDTQGELGFVPPVAAFEQARRAATTALKLDPRRAEAHAVLGRVHTVYDWDWTAAGESFHQALALAPGSEDVLNCEGLLSLALGRWDDALSYINAAIALDPLDPSNFYFLAYVQVRRGHQAEAEAAMRRVLDIRPNYTWAHHELGVLMLTRGDRSGALDEMQKETDDWGRQHGLAMAYFSLGQKVRSDGAIALIPKTNNGAFEMAELYGFLGQPDEAMRWLDRAYTQKDPDLYLVNGDPLLKGLAPDPRFKAFLRKMNLPE